MRAGNIVKLSRHFVTEYEGSLGVVVNSINNDKPNEPALSVIFQSGHCSDLPFDDRLVYLGYNNNQFNTHSAFYGDLVARVKSLGSSAFTIDAVKEATADNQELVSIKNLYLISGRISGDDDDTARIVEAENIDDAAEFFSQRLRDDANRDESAEVIVVYGDLLSSAIDQRVVMTTPTFEPSDMQFP